MPKMTIRECMDAALQLINQYSIAGTVVPATYNDQADDENRMVNLINDAQMQIAVAAKPIEAEYVFSVPGIPDTEKPGEFEVGMPEDFNHFIAIYFKPDSDSRFQTVDARQYKWIGDTTLLVPDSIPGEYRVVYNRYPVRYNASTDTSTQLDNTPDTHELIPYFVGALLALDTNPKTYFALYNVWETRLSRLGVKPAHAVSTEVEDVYGFSNFGGLW